MFLATFVALMSLVCSIRRCIIILNTFRGAIKFIHHRRQSIRTHTQHTWPLVTCDTYLWLSLIIDCSLSKAMVRRKWRTMCVSLCVATIMTTCLAMRLWRYERPFLDIVFHHAAVNARQRIQFTKINVLHVTNIRKWPSLHCTRQTPEFKNHNVTRSTTQIKSK